MSGDTSIDVGTAGDNAVTAKGLRSANVLFVVGVVTLAALTLFLMSWIDVHDSVWQAGPRCDPFGAPSMVRGLTSLIGAAGLVGLAGAGLWLGIRPGNRIARRMLWSAIALAWLAVGGIVVFGVGVIVDCAFVG